MLLETLSRLASCLATQHYHFACHAGVNVHQTMADAVRLAHRGCKVHLATSDPASHLSETLYGTIAGRTVSKIDPQIETARYRNHILEAKGGALDAHGKALFRRRPTFT